MSCSISAAVVFFAAVAVGVDDEPFRKKVIACSWDLGKYSVYDVLSNKAAFAALPIDGARISANGIKLPDGKPLEPWRAFYSPLWPKDALVPLVKPFREATAIPSLRHSFTGFSIARTPKTRVDFRDDVGWAQGFANLRQLAALARDGGLKGLIMDPEDYGKGKQFTRLDGDPPYDEAAKLARRRGREFADAVFGEYPSMTILSFWAFSHGRQYAVQPDPREAMRRKGELFIPFLDGMLDAMPPTAKFVDGDEPSYNYSAYGKDWMNYADKAAANRACIALISPENRYKFRAQVQMGFAVYLDRYTNPKGKFYYTGPVSGSRLVSFDENLRGALRASDEYVWFWCEKFAWVRWQNLTNPKLRVGFAKDRTWDDELPGMYDSIWAATRPQDFLARRFPEIRGKGGCTNILKCGVFKLTGKEKYGRPVRRIPVKRGERYVVEYTAKGAGITGSVSYFNEKGGRQWGLSSTTETGEGLRRILVAVPQYTGFINFGVGKPDDGTTGEVSGIGVYRLPAPPAPEEETANADNKAKSDEKGEQKK